ncbi:MAG: TIGR04283 family arsenosugar biosynthesis glycosyltransferase [Pseudomonadota bacterium]
MTAPLTIVIPTLEAAKRIGPCLGALSSGVFDGLIREVILVDGGSKDEIGDIAEATGATFLTSPRGRGGQLRLGAAHASTEWLLFLHADTVLQPGWIEAIRNHIDHRPEKAGYFDLRFDQDGLMPTLTAGWANWRSRLFALPYGDQALLIPRRFYKDLGGHPQIPLMEDVALVRRIGRRRLAPLKTTAITSAARYREQGWIRRGLRNLVTLFLFQLGTPPEKLVAWYEKE